MRLISGFDRAAILRKKGATRAHTGHAEALFCDFKKSTSDDVKLDAEKIMLKRTEIQ
jgi:hypothetical protein